MTSLRPKNNRGIALLITLAVITLMVPLALELQRRVLATVTASAAGREHITLLNMAASGVHAGMAILIKDRNETDIDSLQEDWAHAEKIDPVLAQMLFEEGTLTLKITDERARIQVNALIAFPEGKQFNPDQYELWLRFFDNYLAGHPELEDIEPVALVNAVKDWLDSGDDDAVTGLTGAESPYYESLDPPYAARNGPLDSLAELALVKGITPALLYGDQRVPGLIDYLSVYGLSDMGGNTYTYDGKVNINTADAAVIAALLPPESADLAQAIVEYRQENENLKYIHDLSSPTWYKEVPGAADVKIKPELITTTSDIFRLEATATLKTRRAGIIAVVRRDKDNESGRWYCRVLNWQVK